MYYEKIYVVFTYLSELKNLNENFHNVPSKGLIRKFSGYGGSPIKCGSVGSGKWKQVLNNNLNRWGDETERVRVVQS